ncbi:MAG TPA: hypothetical protein PLQ76_03555, partial [bacterium]|nr:hypothetical protein [bacterium]
MLGDEYILFNPEITSEGHSGGGFSLVVDAVSGLIVKAGARAEVGEWLKSRIAEGGLLIDEINCGALLPGLTEGHNHVMLYSVFETLKAVTMLGCADKEEAKKRLKTTASKLKTPDAAVLAIAFDTSKVYDFSSEDIDEAVGERPALVMDISLHSGIVSSYLMKKISEVAKKMDRPLFGKMTERGEITEEYTLKALEIVESGCTEEEIALGLEKKLFASFAKGVTTMHDLMPTTASLFVAALKLKKRWESEYGFEFPIRMFYLSGFHLDDLKERMPELESEGLIDAGKLAATVGLKLFADGSFGAHTAKVTTPYVDTGADGIYFLDPEQMEREMTNAL